VAVSVITGCPDDGAFVIVMVWLALAALAAAAVTVKLAANFPRWV